MTTFPLSPRLLVLSAVLLAVVGVALLGMPHGLQPPAPAASLPARATTDPSPAAPTPTTDALVAGTPASTPAASTPEAGQSALPPHGEGTAGDAAIQKALEAAWPPDLPSGDARELLAAGRELLRADATSGARWTRG